MKIFDTELPGVKRVEPSVHTDSRGYFFENYQAERYRDFFPDPAQVQDNISHSKQHVLRGLHYQLDQPQAKLVSVLQGQVFDVAVDFRTGSPHFGRWVGVLLDDRKPQQLFIPAGFLHGFLVLSHEAVFSYKCSSFYNPQGDRGVHWSDPQIAIQWPIQKTPIVSEKDDALPLLNEVPVTARLYYGDL